jgi:lipopolysaccharide biosynthesis protein
MTRLVALHLPQFHRIAENDDWWGQGFTEWTLVRRATPRFRGHVQPREPEELGYYDLTDEKTLSSQSALASRYGIDAFCFYHYWFGGQRLLQRPVQQMLDRGRPSFPFLLCWANENWTRAFDGGSRETLVAQTYPHGDATAHAQALAPFFADRRYVNEGGRPVFLVYRAATLPPGYLESWRGELSRLGIDDPYVIRVESFPEESGDPAEVGCDAAMEFAPRWRHLPRRGTHARVLSALARRRVVPARKGVVVADYAAVAASQLDGAHDSHECMPCVAPSWDNTPRRPSSGTVLDGATPEKYQAWLEAALGRAARRDLPFVFINAWNEWSEGAYLEPDAELGRARLEATLSARERVRPHASAVDEPRSRS